MGASTTVVRMRLLASLLALLLVTGSLLLLAAPAAGQGDRVVRVTARQFEFLPGRIVATAGETLTLIFRSDDVTHGVYIDGQGVDEVLTPGAEVTITIVPTTPGKYKIRCSVTCGPLHPFMVGELIVEEGGANLAFLGALASALGAAGIGVAYAYRRRDRGD